jgi:hypothetical protein
MEHLFEEILESEALRDAMEAEKVQRAKKRGYLKASKETEGAKNKGKEKETEDSDEDMEEIDRVKMCCFTVDIDSEVEFSEEWNNKGIPFVVFFFNGRQVVLKKAGDRKQRLGDFPFTELSSANVKKPRLGIADGGVMGALKRETMESIVSQMQMRVLMREYSVYI